MGRRGASCLCLEGVSSLPPAHGRTPTAFNVLSAQCRPHGNQMQTNPVALMTLVQQHEGPWVTGLCRTGR